MSISQSQQLAAKIWLQSYAHAIEVIKVSANKDRKDQYYQRFLNGVVSARRAGHFERDFNKLRDAEFVTPRQVELFRFSQYVFLKYFPKLDAYKGSCQGFKMIIDQGISQLRKAVVKQ